MAKTDRPNSNPALSELARLVGDWNSTLSNALFLPSPTASVRGRMEIAWVEGGGYLVMRQRADDLAPPAATWLIGRDDAQDHFTVCYSDARGVSRVYSMSLAQGVWKIWRDAPGFAQRFEARLSRDHRRAEGQWEKCTDGHRWEHDFDVLYERR